MTKTPYVSFSVLGFRIASQLQGVQSKEMTSMLIVLVVDQINSSFWLIFLRRSSCFSRLRASKSE